MSKERSSVNDVVVSIVIPTFNRARYLQEALDSCLAQTFTDREIIVVDDGSTDATPELIRSRYEDRVRYIRQENRGAGAARNNGASLAAGKYLAFLDSDDLWLPEKLERMVAFMNRGAFDLAGHLTFLLKDGRTFENPRACAPTAPDGTLERPRRAIVDGRFFQTLTTMCTRDLFGRSGGFPEEFRNAQDTLWAWNACLLGRVGLLAQFLSVYRIHEGQTADYTTARSLLYRIKSRKQMLQGLGRDESDLRRPLKSLISRSMFQYASALRAAGDFGKGAAAAMEALRARPSLASSARLAAWFLGRDFRRKPFWRF